VNLILRTGHTSSVHTLTLHNVYVYFYSIVCVFATTASPASLTSDTASPPKATAATSAAASTASSAALRRPSHVVHCSAASSKSAATDSSGAGRSSRDTQQQQQQQKQPSSKQLTSDARSEATPAKGEGVYHGRRYSQSSHEVSSATELCCS
jgi:hypothetical protein